MKKLTKLLVLVLSLALICGIFAIAAFAEDGTEQTASGWQYVNANGETVTTDSMQTAFASAKDGTTVTLLSDVTVNTLDESGSKISITNTNNITVDLGGHTVYLNQPGKEQGIVPKGSKTLTVKNGSIVCSVGNASKAHAIFNNIGTNAVLNIENVNTYGYAIAYVWSRTYTINVTGGQHYSYLTQYDHSYAGWICGGNNINATVKDADIFLLSSDSLLVNMSHYKATDVTKMNSVATFDNCNIVASSASHNILKYLNNKSTVTFTNCDIFGTINPTSRPGQDNADKENVTVAQKGAVVVGAGCRLSSALGEVAVWADGVTPVAVQQAETILTNSPSGYYPDGNFALKTMYKSCASYAYADSAIDFAPEKVFLTENADCIFTITAGGKTYYTDDISAALSLAPAGATVTLNKDHTVYADASLGTINNALTIDLNGKTLTISQSGFTGFITVATSDTVTMKNGTLIASCDNNIFSALKESLTRGLDRAIPVFVAYNSPAVDLVIDNVNTYSGALFHNESASGSKFTINGGIHQAVSVGTKFTINGTSISAMNNGGILQSRTNTIATFNNAKFWMNYCSSILTSSHQNETGTKKTEVTYNDCTVVQNDTNNKPLILVSNSNTYVYFNNTDVYGPLIVPSVENSESKMGTANVVFGKDSSYGYKASGVTSSLITPTVQSGLTTFAISQTVKIADTNVGAVNASGNFHREDLAAGLVGGAINKSYAETYSVYDTPAFEIVKGGATVTRPNTDLYGIKEAIAEADASSTVKLLADLKLTLTADLNPGKSITIDLGGYTMYVEQNGKLNNGSFNGAYSFVTSNTLKFANGTIMMAASAQYSTNKANQMVNALVQPNSGAKIYFENVNTYGGAITYSWGYAYSVYVDGGEHHVYQKHANITYPGFICGNNNITAEIKNATIYLDHKEAYLFGFQNYKDTTKAPKSSAYVYNCTIVDNEDTYGIIRGLNKYSTVTFEKCDIIGKIAPGNTDLDVTKNNSSFGANDNVPVAGSIVIGAGCRFTDATIGNNIVVLANGVKLYDADVTETLTVKSPSSLWNVDGFKFNTTTKSVTFNLSDVTAVTGVDFVFEYVKGGKTFVIPATNANVIVDVFGFADKGTTIKLLADYTWNGTTLKYVQRDVILDLGGHTLTVQQNPNAANNYIVNYFELQNGEFTIQNGNVRTVLMDAEGKETDKAYPLVRIVKESKVSEYATLNLINVNTYGGNLIYNMTFLDAVINVEGGEHYLTQKSKDVTGTFIETRANSVVTVTGAKFYVSNNSNGLVTSMSYKQTEGTKASSFTFTDCDIYGETSSKNLISNSNEFTTFAFNNCKIVGAINPAKHNFESSVGVATDGSIVFGMGTSYINGVTLKYVAFAATPGRVADTAIEIVFSDSTYGTKTASGVVMTVGAASTEVLFAVLVDGKTAGEYGTLADAIASAPAGATIKLLKDATIEAYGTIATIDKAVTIDLNGNHLQVVQYAAGGHIVINTGAAVVVTNGRISCAADAEYRKTLTTTTQAYDVGEPLFATGTVAVNLTLNNVSTYSAGLFYNTVSGSKFTVNGGYHQQNAITYPDATYYARALVISKANVTVLFKDASIYLDWCGSLLVSTAKNEADYNKALSTFTYEGCKVNFTGNNNQFIRVANGHTYVYFKDSDVYGAFVKPTCKDNDAGGFTSANLHFDKDCTWYNPAPTGVTLINPTLPEGYAFFAIADSKATITYDKYAISGTIQQGTLNFPATASTATFTVAYEVVDTTDFAFMVTNGSTTTYYNSTSTLEEIVAAASAGSTITLLQDYVMVTDRYLPTGKKAENLNDWESHPLTISKNLTIDLGGCTLTVEMHAKNGGFKIATTSAVVFQNGNIVAVSHEDFKYNNGTHDAKTSPVVQVSTNGANVTFNNVNTEIGALIYSYGNRYTVTVNGGVHVLTSERDANTSGFIAAQADITATVNNATFYVNYDYVAGASSYREFANINNGSYTADNFKDQISTTFTFNNCDIIAPTADKSVVGQANEFVKFYFNDCNIFGSITPTKNGSDSTYKYTIAGGKFITSSVSACACESFSDTTGDGKCDNSGCGKYDPDKIVSYTVKTCPASNIVLGEGTRYSSGANMTNTSFANAYVSAKPVSDKVNIGGNYYDLDLVADYMYVTWYNETGAVIKVTKVDGSFENLSDVAPEYEGKGGVTNGWYKVGGYVANSWTSFLGGTDAVNLANVDLTKDNALYPQANEGKISAYLSAAMYNLSTTGAIRNNFYIPETPDNVEILGVYVGSREVTGTLVLYRDYKGEPVYYTMYVINEVGAVEFTKTTEVVVKYKVNGNIELEQVYTLSPEKYANAVYNDSTLTSGNQYSTAAYNVVADLVRYSYLLSEYANVENEKLTALYNKMATLCSKLPADNEMISTGTNVFELAGAGSIAYEASSYEPRWKFTLNASAQIVDIKITLDGYHGGVYSDRTNFGPKTYGIEQATKDANGYILSAYTNNIPVYNITQPFTIIFTKADGTTISGTFDFKAYYNSVGKGTAVADFMKSVVALANSTIAYKYPDGKVSAEDVADFFSCDHEGATVQTAVVDGNYNFKPHLCNKCNSWLFYYEDYGAVADGKTNRTRATHVSGTNDYEAIYWTHANANEWKNRSELSLGKNVAVVGNSNPSEAKYYYLSLPEGRGVYQVNGAAYKLNQNLGSITIATDTSWNGVNWIIDDDAICNSSSCTCVNEMGVARKHNYNSQSIFVLDEYGNENVVENWADKVTSLKPGDTNIGYAPGRAMLVYVKSTERYINYRYGSNASDGVAINEILLVDEFGNIDPSTPVQWTYTKLTTVTAYEVDTDPIKISGLDKNGNIASSYESYVNNSLTITIPHYVTCGRDITIQRSNATIEGIDRFFTEEPAKGYDSGNRRFAYNFISVQWCSNATIKDMLVMNHNNQKGASGTGQGSYEFDGSDANATSWINCRTKNMFSNSSDGSVAAYPIYRGLFGTNRMRNMYLKDCYLNSFDAHTGAYNVTIEDSTLEHMNFVGGGDINIKNVIIYTSTYSTKTYNASILSSSTTLGFAFNLRDDYGSSWNGNVYVDGLTVRYGKGQTSNITIFRGSYKNQYYGFDSTYVPQDIVINNFHTQQYEASVSGGVRTETLGSMDLSSTKVYLYYAINDLKSTDVPATSVAGANKPTATSGSDYGTNHLECTKNLTITNSPALKASNLPTGSFWTGMNVTIDGQKYVASKKSSWSSSYEWKAQ